MVYGIILRLFIVIIYNGITVYPDSQSYIELGTYLYNLDLLDYSGGRTPGYPVLIAMAAGNLNITVFFQLILGLLNMVLL